MVCNSAICKYKPSLNMVTFWPAKETCQMSHKTKPGKRGWKREGARNGFSLQGSNNNWASLLLLPTSPLGWI